jgi:phosphohistidine swiveling domain-containing protein
MKQLEVKRGSSLAERFISDLKQDEIIVWDGAYSPLFIMFDWNQKKHYQVCYKTPASPLCLAIKGRDSALAFSNTRYNNYATEVFREYWNNKESIQVRLKHCRLLQGKIENLYYKIQAESLEEKKETQLLSWMKQINCLVGELVASSIFIEVFDKDVASGVIGRQGGIDFEMTWEKATSPAFESFEMRRLNILMKLYLKYGASSKYPQFIYTDYFDAPDQKQIEKKILKIFNSKSSVGKSRAELKKYHQELLKKKRQYKKWRTTLSVKEKKLADYVQIVMEMRDWRKDPIAQAQALLFEIGQELLLRADLDRSVVLYLLPSELERGISWLKNNRRDLARRPNGMVAYYDSKGNLGITLNDVEVVKKKIKNETFKKEKNLEVIQGQIGAKGLARGKVKIIKDAQFAEDFSVGDILVTGMTRPEFVPLMKKAAAIITDEGGITCHAAIVSREMNKPCIIGTKIATLVLHDGDLVEVDADKGIVKIIKHKK